jgi:hypothetical protein
MASLNDILRVVPTLGMGVGVTIQNVYHLRVTETGGVDDADVLDDMGEYLEDIYSELLTRIVNDVTFEEYSVQNLTVDVDLGISGFPTLTAGQSSEDPLPSGVAGLSLGRTETPGHYGRKFWPPGPESLTLDNYFTSNHVSAMNDAALATWSPFQSTTGHDYMPGILDRTTGGIRDVVEVISTNIPAYQRRRRAGTGI